MFDGKSNYFPKKPLDNATAVQKEMTKIIMPVN